MSLINQMLRDLQQRRGGAPVPPPQQPSAPPSAAVKRRRRPRRRVSLPNLLGTVPPIFWVALGGVAGLVLLWGASSWLTEMFGPGEPLPVPKPPPEMVAVANKPLPATSAAQRRTPPVPIEVPPPPPPLAYGSAQPAPEVISPAQPSAPAAAAPPASATAPPTMPRTVFSDQPAVTLPPSILAPAPAAPRRAETGTLPAVKVVAPVPGTGASAPGRLHPDMLPGAVNATNLALQQAAREAAAVPLVVTPYGQAEAAYREGRAAYEANRPETSVAMLRRALGHYPGHLPARELLADQLEMAGQGDEAFTLLQQGLVIAPDYAPFRKRAARLLLDRGDPAGATRILTGGGLPRVEDDPELHQLLAGAYLRLGENFLAAQTFRNLVVQAPEDGRLWVGLGDALAADGQPLEARKAYRRALAVGGLSREEAVRAQAKLGPR